MGDSASWWAKKLGQPSPRSTPDTWNTPRVGQPTPSYQRPPQAPIPSSDALIPDENGQIHVADAIVRWRGGDGNKEQDLCPKCGGRNYFSRAEGRVMNRSGQTCAPAPICFNCGYNGIFEAFGGAYT